MIYSIFTALVSAYATAFLIKKNVISSETILEAPKKAKQKIASYINSKKKNCEQKESSTGE